MPKKKTFPVYGALIGLAFSVRAYWNDPSIAAGVASYGYVLGLTLFGPVIGWTIGYVAGSVRDRWAADDRKRDQKRD